MFEIGSSLRQARTKRGLTNEDVHKAVHIRTRYLTALEEERWELLPGEAYTKGFLRTYAEFLDLNSDLYVDEYDERVAAHEEQPFVPDSLAPGGRRRLLFRSIVGTLGVVALVVGIAAWQLGGPAEASHVPVPGAAPAPARHPAPAVPVARRVKPVVVARTPSVATIRATRNRCWLSIRLGGPAGKEIFRGILDRGRSLRYPLATHLWLRMGRPLALDIRIDGHAVHGLERSPSNLVLTRSGPLAG